MMLIQLLPELVADCASLNEGVLMRKPTVEATLTKLANKVRMLEVLIIMFVTLW